MRSSGRSGLFLLALLAFSFQPLLGGPPVSLLFPGAYSSGDLPARAGDGWLGLYRSGERYELKPARVRIERVKELLKTLPASHPLQKRVDDLDKEVMLTFKAEDGDYAIGDAVVAIVSDGRTLWPVAGGYDRDTLQRVEARAIPLWLFRLDGLSSGPVVASLDGLDERHEGARSVVPGEELRLQVGTRAYRLVRQDDFFFVLSQGTTRQRLNPQGFSPSLLWAGDLDRDGKLDLLLDLPEGDCGGKHHLFLSSRARPGKLVEDVAQFVIPGC